MPHVEPSPSSPALDAGRFAGHLQRRLRPGQRASVYWPGCAGHSPLFERWLRHAPDAAAGVEFSGVWIPGVNRFDPSALHADARACTVFMSRELQAGWFRGAVDFLPLHYSQAVRWVGTPGRFDVLLLHVAPPDRDGLCSLSVAADFTPAALAGACDDTVVLAHINPRLPRTNGPAVPMSRLTAFVEAEEAPLTVATEPAGPVLRAVARQVAALVDDGDTLQFGLGKLQAAVLAELHRHRHLRIHAGMVSEGLLALRDAGALAAEDVRKPPVCAGVALGSEALYRAVAEPALMRFAPVEETHAQATLAAIPRLIAINSALEIDLLGQVNCETLGGRQLSGVGGLVDFLRGARASAGGKAIVAATANAGRDGRSRIVPLLPAGPVGIARGDTDLVVTEHGVADLRQLGVEARARALIAIAAPEHRDDLGNAWHTLRRSL
jgi:acyl-CoA hydrolase